MQIMDDQGAVHLSTSPYSAAQYPPRRLVQRIMDPELARIRRERYLAQKKNEDGDGTGKNAGNEAAAAPTAKNEAEVIVIDSDSENYDNDTRSQSKPPFLRKEEVVDVDKNGVELSLKKAAAARYDDDDESVQCISSPREQPRKKPRTESICYVDEYGKLHDTHKQTVDRDGWIWAESPNKKKAAAKNYSADVEGLCREFERIVSRESDTSQITSDVVLYIAVRHHVVCGKWMIYQKHTPALVWQQIRDAILNNQLGDTAKISNSADPKSGLFIICIYCTDFTDKQEVHRIRCALHRATQNGEKTLYFKPDCFTYLNLYSGNKFKIRTTIYACGGKDDEQCSTLFVNGERCNHTQNCPRCFPRCKS